MLWTIGVRSITDLTPHLSHLWSSSHQSSGGDHKCVTTQFLVGRATGKLIASKDSVSNPMVNMPCSTSNGKPRETQCHQDGPNPVNTDYNSKNEVACIHSRSAAASTVFQPIASACQVYMSPTLPHVVPRYYLEHHAGKNHCGHWL